ncbi:copper chaperone PCu(A)C [Roseovarius pelagicus]|uniref:Copper chaperone PCu(A)C n=1 Tax=Roseovarius pelagicus TaxID=2980108 RepID=A0ABY6DAM2_9RHOB|nr:copper chaperone PCu(A)C [Roseovarius pelagicus]UXX82233.1 copper chaperone PCu(A)C [Roseovarius pelagicus]
MKRTTFAILAALTFVCTPAIAHEFKAGDLVIDHPMAFETTKTAMSGGGYLTITNTGSTADRLIAVRADFPKVQLHTTEEKDGVARMIHLEAIDLPAGETVTLAPGGMHVMFMGLGGDPFEVGEAIPATLVFEKSGEIDVKFNVEERTGHSTDHSTHGASD